MKHLIHRILPLLLAVVLPIMPLLRSLVPAASQGLAPSAWSIILKIGVGSAALLGTCDAVSGASVSILPPVNGGYTLTLTNGVFYKIKLAESPYAAGSWTPNPVQNTSTAVFTIYSGFYLTNATGFLAATPAISGGRQTNRYTIYVWGAGSHAASSVFANFTNITLPTIPGTLVVTASPPALVTLAKNLTWNLDGVWQTNGFTNLFLDPGSHTVAFTNISGWLTPPTQSLTITSAVQTRISVVYTQLLGGLQVIAQPLGPPARTATWTIDGSPAYGSGTITNLSVSGTHTLVFNAVSGYTTPASQTITVTNGFTNVINAVYLSPSAGTVQVNLGPANAVAAGALWQLDNGPWLPAGTATNGSPGSHTLNFTNVAGWAAPASQPVTLSAGTLTTAAATYVPASAALQVNLTPPAAVTAGAAFQLDGGTWQPAGTLLTALNPGSHVVGFNPVYGWVAPTSQSVTLTNGQTNILGASYVLITAPVITQSRFDGANIIMSGTGTANAGFSLRSTNNLAIPLAGWPVIGTGTINAVGGFNYTQSVNSAIPTAFFLFSSP